MLYNPPFGSSDPDASYIDRNTPGAVRGSKVPAAALEAPQREIVSLISASGLAPSAGDLQQVAKAIQTGAITYAVAGGTANALTAALPIAPTALTDGMTVRIRPAATSTSATPTLNLNAHGAKTITNPDGSSLVDGALAAGAPAMLLYSALTDKWILLTQPTNGGGAGQNGWCYLPGKMILQWGRYTGICWGDEYAGNGVYEGDVTVVWPRAFASAVYAVVNGAGDVAGRGQQEQAWIFNPTLVGGGGVIASRTLNATVVGNYMVVGK